MNVRSRMSSGLRRPHQDWRLGAGVRMLASLNQLRRRGHDITYDALVGVACRRDALNWTGGRRRKGPGMAHPRTLQRWVAVAVQD